MKPDKNLTFEKSLRLSSSKTIILFMIMILIVSLKLYSQEGEIRFHRITIEDGLSQSNINCIIQDSRGFMWFGTEDGLNRYDGYSFKVFKHDPDDQYSLSYNWVTSIYEDKSRVLWIGTQGGGLNIFDQEKERFIHFRHNPNNPKSLSNNYINSIYEDRSGVLWIGTENGLNKLIPQAKNVFSPTFTQYKADPNNPKGLSNSTVYSICEDRSGVLWIGTEDGLNRLVTKDREKDSLDFIHCKSDPRDPHSLSHNLIRILYEDRSGVLWVGTERGLNKLVLDSKKDNFLAFIHYEANPNNPQSLRNNSIYSIYEDMSGVLWIGTDGGGLNRFDHRNEIFIHYSYDPNDPNSLSNNRIRSIYEGRSRILWVGTHVGLNKFDQEKKHFVHYQARPNDPNSLNNNYVRAICEDKSGLIWVGTYGGLCKIDCKNKKFTHYTHNLKDPNSLSNNRVMSIYEHPEEAGRFLWIATYGGGLDKFDREKKKFIHFRADPNDPDSLSDDFVRVIYGDQSGALWIGTFNGGLNRFDCKKEKFIQYRNDPDDPGSLSNNMIFSICEDQFGMLWVGTNNGLNKFDREREPFIRYQADLNNPNSLSNNMILSIYKDRSGVLWIGTLGGLNKFNWDREDFAHYMEKDGLPNEMILDILEDDKGNLWLTHNKGISRFNPRTKNFKNYDVKDGLQSNEFNKGACCKSRTGEIFFGGINGFNSYYPDRIRDNPYIPQVVITNFQIFNKPVPIGEMKDGRTILKKSIIETRELKLSHRDRVVSFEFAALHYSSPEKNEYAYMMEGFEKDWNFVGQRRFASYTNLPPGEYVFKVKGSNNDGVWNEKGATLQIKVTPPFWKTMWFYSLCVFCVLFSGITAYRVRVRQLRKHAKKLEIIVVERTGQLKEANLKLEKANKKLEQLATHDDLTGIFNHRRFSEFYELEWRRAVRGKKPISIILIDIDYFKLYNDTYGHQEGDECLRKIAQELNKTANRPGDMVARYGGEEFVIVLGETDKKGALSVAERARAKIEMLQIVHEKSTISKHVTISLGCASTIPEVGRDLGELIKAADEALYKSKGGGRNTVRFSVL